MSFSKKLYGGFGLMLALLVVLSVTASVVVRGLNRDLDRAANITARQQYVSGQINADVLGLANSARGGVLSAVLGNQPQSQEHLAHLKALSAELEQAVAELDKLTDVTQDGSLLQTLKRQAAGVREFSNEMTRELSSQHMDVALKIFGEKMEPQLAEIGQQASSLVKQQSVLLAKASESAHAKSSRTEGITMGLALLALAAGVGVLWIVRQVNEAFKSAAARLAKNADLVSTAAADVSGTSQSLAREASQQAASLEETSASTEEITSITRHNSEHAAQVADLMLETEQGIGRVDESLDRMVEQMKEIHTSSNKVVSIIKVIDTIAFQTNILALNAAVEAARAGDAGLGFAVVADEVRSLAQRCTQAAKDTTDLIQESIKSTHDGSARLDQMTSAIRGLTENAARVKTLVDGVSSGSRQQAQGVEQISHTILEMQKLTQKTAANADRGASAGIQLTDYSNSLKQLVQEIREMVGAEA
ncbi:MAG: MCP four helix bundle domain-containing protein [Acidobacteriia bacterium]|nr:MCP four helix bundle domain-containing protein [Terriglobia bacterium]